MEPDYDKIVCNKIRETEQQPILWNKQGVWQKLQPKKTRGWHYNSLYYAAAAVVVLLIYVVIRPTHNEMDVNVFNAKFQDEEKLTQPITSEPLEKNGNHSRDPETTNPNNSDAGSLTELDDSGSKNSGSAQHQRKPADPTFALVMADINTQEELPLQQEVSSQEKLSLQEVQLPEQVTIKEQKIRPIVGVIVESDLTPVAKVKRKKSLRKLESPGTVPWEDPESPLVFMVRK